MSKPTKNDKMKTLYGVSVKNQDDIYFWKLYDTIDDAVAENGNDTAVYEFAPKYLGDYRNELTVVNTKHSKTARRKAA